jgi:uncharacterized protein (DUF934 family)
MALIKDGQIAQDTWRALSDEDSVIGNGPIIISFERWRDSRDALKRHNGPLGIRMKSDQPPALIADDIDRFDLIALEFPTLQDGRAFSYARLLRERYGFKGDLRAVGDVYKDQLFFMQRCGFSSFELPAGRDPQDAMGALKTFSFVYAPAADGTAPASRRRGDKPAAG